MTRYMILGKLGLSLVVTASLLNISQAGEIPSQQEGWNRDNVDVYVTDDPEADPIVWTLDNSDTVYPSNWDPVTPQYLGFESRIFDDDDRSTPLDNTTPLTGTHLGTLVAKNPPVGEKPGIKIINNDPGYATSKANPPNCIISTSYLEERSDGTGSGYLDGGNPEQVICSSPFQTHKRFKIGMLPATVATVDPTTRFGSGIDVVFNVETGPETQYQIFQKINNWTDSRLDGFTIEVGTGVGSGFAKASALSAPESGLTLSVPNTIWDANQLATFSAGLFSPVGYNHFPDGGYFDKASRAGFEVDEYAGQSFGDTLTAVVTLGSDYSNTPPGINDSYGQFGDWLPNSWLPTGIFHDVDQNPDTDDELVAWWGFNPSAGLSGEYGWMTGASTEPSENFAVIPQSTVDGWAADQWYHAGDIDDLVNVGLNYIVTIPDLMDSGTFTIRITPRKSADQTVPGFVANQPPDFIPPIEGTIEITPSPTFDQGQTLSLMVVDGSFAGNDPDTPDTIQVTVTSDLGSLETENVTLNEVAGDRGVFRGTLDTVAGTAEGGDDDGVIVVDIGTVVTAEYTDADPVASPTAETTAIEATTFFVTPVPGGGAAVFGL